MLSHSLKKKQDYKVILLNNIYSYWHYSKSKSNVLLQLGTIPRPILLLNPLKVKGKGRPKGALSGGSRVALSNTR